MSTMLDFAPPEFGFPDLAASYKSLITPGIEQRADVYQIEQISKRWLSFVRDSNSKTSSAIAKIIGTCELLYNRTIPIFVALLETVIARLQKDEELAFGFLEHIPDMTRSMEEIFKENCEEAIPILKNTLSQLESLVSDHAEMLRDARWQLMLRRVKACPSKGVGPIHGDAAGMDEFLASIP
ncbi:MAG: hypothetical protein GC191_05325 [Azospirillum sp.]|nr:hypothetical protein [Azospirillum sp.]